MISIVYGQFSPGELSKVHHDLEGTQQCARCHEVGAEITGSKCLDCHKEIRQERENKHGYHYSIADKKCVSCHKEHLGLDARITLVDLKQFDHASTGFLLTGKHATTECVNCHKEGNIKNTDILAKVKGGSHKTFLGLKQDCESCHEDRHRGSLGSQCQSCHTTTGWKPASNFNHARTKYPLAGKHSNVACVKCHISMSSQSTAAAVVLSTKDFTDCTPCHSSPHNKKFTNQSCTTCHTAEGWQAASSKKFDHALTAFPLVGKHAQVQCQQCHRNQGSTGRSSMFKPPHAKCMDCHKDYHEGVFSNSVGKECSSCHTEQGYVPSTFSLLRHEKTKFSLSGGHLATPCAKCHAKNEVGKPKFMFASLHCKSCHEDIHRGQFDRFMVTDGCGTCHSTSEWKRATFDHSKTKFVLKGKHSTVTCVECHGKPLGNGRLTIEYKNRSMECESCHKDIHAGQFVSEGKTRCATCHTDEGWKTLVFNHNSQSTFSLTGAHAKVACRSCHKEENMAGNNVIRFKPVSAACETCHQGNEQ